MSRLDSFIRRLQAQRTCIDAAAERVAAVEGPVFELGLGNGRTYDHLRELCPDREIFVFEREVSAHPDCVPDAEHLFEGTIDQTLAAVEGRFSGAVALVHADLGSGQAARDAETAAMVSALLPALLAAGAVVVSDQQLNLAGAEPLPLPPDIQVGRYFMYRWGEGPA